MQVQRALIDKDFDRYALSVEGIRKHELELPHAALEPLDAVKTTRKAHWEARMHHNALVVDPFRSAALHTVVAYYLDAEYRVMQVIGQSTNTQLSATAIAQFQKPAQRKENPSVQAAGKGLIVFNDGVDTLRILRSPDAEALNALWTVIYECRPLGGVPSLVLRATYDEALQRIHVVIAEPLVGQDTEAAYRLSIVEVLCHAPSSDSMDIDGGVIGIEHSAVALAIVGALPTYVSMKGNDVLLLAEGQLQLLVDSASASSSTESPAATTANHATKRHHEESEQEMDVDDVLAKVPRAGIGYHGDISDVKHPHDLGLVMDMPLEQRFQKSSTPFSSLDEPLHSTSSAAVKSPTAAQGPLEVPTPDTILGGFEECDDVDPNAKATLLLIDAQRMTVTDQLAINCRSFRYLCPSAFANVQPGSTFDMSLLFQHDVHGLLFEASVTNSRLTLRHASTFPAFGFVQASKQDKKFMSFAQSGALASIGEFERRVFVYHGPRGSEANGHVRKQHVVEVGDHQLLGMRVAGGCSILLLSPHHVYHIDMQ